MKTHVSLKTTIEPHDLVYYLGLEPALYERKANVLPLDHRVFYIRSRYKYHICGVFQIIRVLHIYLYGHDNDDINIPSAVFSKCYKLAY